jgi:valyl-tRNA synthetase
MRTILLTLLLILPLFSFAQTGKIDLTPKTLKDNSNKTYFMWDIPQAKEIATKISDGQKDAEKVVALEEKVVILKKENATHEKKAETLNSDIKTLEGMLSDQQEIVKINGKIIEEYKTIDGNQTQTIEKQSKKLHKRSNTIKVLVITNTITALGLIVLLLGF